MRISRIIREDLRLVGNLRETAKQYFDLKKDRARTAVELYKTFLKNYIFNIENDRLHLRFSLHHLREFFRFIRI